MTVRQLINRYLSRADGGRESSEAEAGGHLGREVMNAVSIISNHRQRVTRVHEEGLLPQNHVAVLQTTNCPQHNAMSFCEVVNLRPSQVCKKSNFLRKKTIKSRFFYLSSIFNLNRIF